jgi:hypothetical protein
MDRDSVVAGVATEVLRFARNRRKKLEGLQHKTMAENPFLNPLIMEMNGYETLADLADFAISGHLSEGHATGFGKLVDERIVPVVFGTVKLTKAFREKTRPYHAPMFGVIDHLRPKEGGTQDLLPLKAGRWSIQLGQALNMNHSFANLIDEREAGFIEFDRIVIGVLYGTEATLTDKFQIARGVGPHDVVDIREHVDIKAGRRFWAWLNDGIEETQEWVLDGILQGIKTARDELGPAAELIGAYARSYEARLSRHVHDNGSVDWHSLLREVNG